MSEEVGTDSGTPAEGDEQRFVTLGRISGVHGVKGWVRVHSDTSPREYLFGERACSEAAEEFDNRHAFQIARGDNAQSAKGMVSGHCADHLTAPPWHKVYARALDHGAGQTQIVAQVENTCDQHIGRLNIELDLFARVFLGQVAVEPIPAFPHTPAAVNPRRHSDRLAQSGSESGSRCS